VSSSSSSVSSSSSSSSSSTSTGGAAEGAILRYTAHDSGWVNGDNMVDGSLSTFGRPVGTGDITFVSDLTVTSGASAGTIDKVFFRVNGNYVNYNNQIDAQPYFDGAAGTQFTIFDNTDGDVQKWEGWFNITDDTNAPGSGSWTWADVQTLEIELDGDDNSGPFATPPRVYQIEVRVDILPPAASAEFYFDNYDSGDAWSFNPANISDGDEGTFGGANQFTGAKQNHRLTSSVLTSGTSGSGTINKVEVRVLGDQIQGTNTLYLVPYFSGTTSGAAYLIMDSGDTAKNKHWTEWVDITSDPSAPSWTWSEIENLDMYLTTYTDQGFGPGNNSADVYKVEMRVT